MILFSFKKMKYSKHILFLTALSLLSVATVFSEPENINTPPITISPNPITSEYLDEIAYYDLQMGAVSVDMYLYLGWAVDEKEDMRKAAEIALKSLESIITDVNGLNAPKEVADVKTSFINAAEYLKGIYKNVEKKDSDTLKNEFDIFNEKYAIYNANFKRLASGKNQLENVKEQEPTFSNKELNEDYVKALSLMKQTKYREARDLLLSLKNRIDKNSSTYDYIMLNLSDISGKMAYDFENVSSENELLTLGDEAIIKYSEEILKKEYSPLFADFYVRWRTATQSFYHGVSNWSNIPNWKYNIKRKELINKIKSYLQDNPRDEWARDQIAQLRAIDNILRGGPMGNDTLNYMGMLYPMPKSKTSAAEDRKDISEKSPNISPSTTIVQQ